MIRESDRALGRVFTPPALAGRLVERTLAPLLAAGRSGALRVLDPACGDGVFLVEAWRYLRGRIDPARVALVGVDVDPGALPRARAALAAAGAADVDLRAADALARDWGDERFDAVIGNPPWISWSGRHAQPLAAARRRTYAGRFATWSGWPCAHALFTELGAGLASGRMGFLLPAQVCDLDGYAPLRALLRREGRVEEPVADLGEAAFAGVVQPGCALVWERGDGGDGHAGGDPFVLGADPAEERAWIERLDACPRAPRGMFVDCGVHTGNCAGKLLHPGGAPLREGRDVDAWRLAAPRRGVRVDRRPGPGEYFRVPPLARFRAVSIVLRQTAARPVAALHRPVAHFRNSVLGCAGVPGVDPALVVAWLNSGVVGRYHGARVREAGQRAFPQVKIRHLRDLPMPDWEHPPRGLAAAARRAARMGADSGLIARIDVLVARWFGLRVEEVAPTIRA